MSRVHIHAPRAQEYLVVQRPKFARKWTILKRCRAWKGNLHTCKRRAMLAFEQTNVVAAGVLATFEWYDPEPIFRLERTR